MDNSKNIVKFHPTPSVEICRCWSDSQTTAVCVSYSLSPCRSFLFPEMGDTPERVLPLFIVHTCSSLHSVLFQNITVLCLLACVIFVILSLL